jgi:hypothetical protein
MKFFIDNLPVSTMCSDEERMNCIHITYLDNLSIWPYLPRCVHILPFMMEITHLERLSEQYAYMCDLKRTLDATVTIFRFCESLGVDQSLGPLCLGNAFRDRENCVFVVFNCVLSTGFGRLSAWIIHLMTNPSVLPNPPQTGLLLAYRSWDWKGAHWTEKINELSDLLRRNRWAKRKGKKLHGSWADE